MSTAHEGKLMKESSLQTQSSISLPSQQRTCMQCMACEQGWKEATLIKAIESGAWPG